MPESTAFRSLPSAFSSRVAAAVRRFPRLEEALVVLLAFVGEVYQDGRIILRPYVYESDARLHEFWMRRFQDPDLFQDPLTQALLDTAYIPYGFRAIHWVASFVVDPVLFAEAMPLVLVPLTAWLCFRIVREHTTWWPAAWLGTALLVLAWDMHRFTGGHQRAYGPPVVLLTLYLLLRRRDVGAGVVPPLAALVYPSAAAVALGTIALSSLRPASGRRLDVRRAVVAGVSAVGAALALYVPFLVKGGAPEIVSRAVAERSPDFGRHTDVHLFGGSTLDYLTQKASGFGLARSGSILVVAALLFLVLRPRNVRVLRWEVWAMLSSSLILFGLGHALLFRLYLPHRYAYAIVPFSAILVAVSWQPTWEWLTARLRPWLAAVVGASAVVLVGWIAIMVFPFGFRLPWSETLDKFTAEGWYYVAALAVGVLLVALVYRRGAAWVAASAVAAALLVGQVALAGGDRRTGLRCGRLDTLLHLRTIPKDAIVAGNPVLLDCVPIVSRRAVVMNEKLFQVWEVDFWQEGRRRMFDSVEAYYGDSTDSILELRRKYGADYLVVERRPLFRRWRYTEPFTTEVRRLRETVAEPARRRLPRECRTWGGKLDVVYDLACVEARSPGS
jgi:hypothetical protein